MALLDIFNDKAFGLTELTHALNRVPTLPNYLESLGIFTPKPIRTLSAAMEKKENSLSLVKTSPRGAPLVVNIDEKRDIRDVRTVRLAKGDTIHSHELQSIRGFGTEAGFKELQTEVMGRMASIRDDINLTLERHRLGAINGLVLDSDGSTLIDWFSFWGISRPATVRWTFSASTSDGSIRTKCMATIRTMERAARGAFTPATRIYALCGDDFFDALIAAKETRETYLNYQAAADLRAVSPRREFNYGGITFVNYQGTDDNSTVAIGAKLCRFFPVGAKDVFAHFMSPGEALPMVNTLGQPFYAMTIPDDKRQMFVDVELYTYPLFACLHPGVLLTGDIA